MYTQAENVVRVLGVETLRVFLAVVNDANSRHMVHNLARL